MKKTLIRGATIITMDQQGDLFDADILIVGSEIQEIAPRINVIADEIVQGLGYVVIPGLINAHMHTWQTALRSVASNWTLLEYFQKMHSGLAKVFTPEDLYIATKMGA
jgi:cytosine/adenosine deaminase-related metal-dependent hydrolase